RGMRVVDQRLAQLGGRSRPVLVLARDQGREIVTVGPGADVPPRGALLLGFVRAIGLGLQSGRVSPRFAGGSRARCGTSPRGGTSPERRAGEQRGPRLHGQTAWALRVLQLSRPGRTHEVEDAASGGASL